MTWTWATTLTLLVVERCTLPNRHLHPCLATQPVWLPKLSSQPLSNDRGPADSKGAGLVLSSHRQQNPDGTKRSYQLNGIVLFWLQTCWIEFAWMPLGEQPGRSLWGTSGHASWHGSWGNKLKVNQVTQKATCCKGGKWRITCRQRGNGRKSTGRNRHAVKLKKGLRNYLWK